MKTYSIFKIKKISLLATLTLLLIWKCAALFYDNAALLPSPEDTFLSLVTIMRSFSFVRNVSFTILRGLLGFAISFVLGTSLGILSGTNKYLHEFLKPFLIVLKTTPIMSIMLLSLIWFGTEKTPVFVNFLVSFPIIYTNILEGTRNVDKNLLEMAHIYDLPRISIYKDIYFPSLMPFLLAGVSTAVSLGWKVTIGAEVLSQPKFSIGNQMWQSKLFLEVDYLLAWTIVAILLSAVSEKCVHSFESKLLHWRNI